MARGIFELFFNSVNISLSIGFIVLEKGNESHRRQPPAAQFSSRYD